MLSKALRLMRIFHDLKQKELAEKLGISKSYLSEIELGKKTPTLTLLESYSQVFEVPVSSILFLSENLESEVNSSKIQLSVSLKIQAMLKFLKLIDIEPRMEE